MSRQRRSHGGRRHPLPRYPSIAGPRTAPLGADCVAFRKYDGSNLRFGWDQTKGWWAQGTRNVMFEPGDRLWGNGLERFRATFADDIERALRSHTDLRSHTQFVVFCEYFGPSSFAGLHASGEEMTLRPFDVMVPDLGFLPPALFLDVLGHLDVAEVVYSGALTRELIESVRAGSLETGEGVVCKGEKPRKGRRVKRGWKVWMHKIKTRAWLEDLERRAGTTPELVRAWTKNRDQQGES